MDAKLLEFLHAQDWVDIGAKVMASAVFWARKYGWKSGETMPKGCTPQSIALDVISDFWLGTRRYNPKWNLVTQLRRATGSKISNLYKSQEAQTTDTVEETEGEPRRRLAQAESAKTDPVPFLEIRDEFAYAIDLILGHPKVQRSADLQKVTHAIKTGLWDVAQIAAKTKMPTTRINQLKRELRDIYPDIAAKMKQNGEGRI